MANSSTPTFRNSAESVSARRAARPANNSRTFGMPRVEFHDLARLGIDQRDEAHVGQDLLAGIGHA